MTRRIVLVLPTLAGVLVLSFMLAHLSGDPTDQILPVDATEAARAAFRAEYGLDRPLPAQLAAFTGRVLQGNFGRSLRFSEPATRLVLERLPATLELAMVTLALAVGVGVPAGVASSRRADGAVDGVVRGLSALTQSLAPFYVGVVAILIFAVWLRLLPTGGRNDWNSVILPACTLALTMVGLIAQMTRACMLDNLRADYVRTARAKGLVDRLVVWRHAFRNAVPPILTLIGLQAGTLMGGVVVTETVFAWPQVARVVRAAVRSVRQQDFIEAAHAVGAGNARIMFRHIVPNVADALVVYASFEFARLVLVEATLGYLGLGVQPPAPTWGGMVNDGEQYLGINWAGSLFPGIAIALLVLSLNSVGESLRRSLAPVS